LLTPYLSSPAVAPLAGEESWNQGALGLAEATQARFPRVRVAR